MRIFCVKINKNLCEAQYNKLMKYLSPDRFQRLNKMLFEDSQRSLIGDILIKHAISKIKKASLGEILFVYNEYGKPYISEDIYFNISHSGKWVVAEINNNTVGIDIEEVAPIDYNIAKRFFTENEYNYVINNWNLSKIERFYNIWTLKESYIKAVGIPLNSFSISITDGDNIIIESNEYGRSNYFLKQYNIDSNYKMAICSTSQIISEELRLFDLDEFYNQLEL